VEVVQVKKIRFLSVFIIIIVLAYFQITYAASENIKVIVDEKEGVFDVSPSATPVPTPSGFSNIDSENIKVQMEMEDGSKMVFLLYPEFAPKTVENFVSLVKAHFYDGLKFHRIIKDFMIQGGDPKGDGTGGSSTKIKGEFSENGFTQNTLKHTKGVISMARSNDPDSATSQFFIMDGDGGFLDGKYAAFGKLIGGEATLDKITGTKVGTNPFTGENSLPENDVIIKKVKILTTSSLDGKQNYKIMIDGKIINFKAAIKFENGGLMLPVDEMLKNIGIPKNKIKWDEKNKSYTILYGKNTIRFTIGQKAVHLNGKSINLSRTTTFYKNIPYISVDCMSAFDRIAFFDGNANTYLISKKANFNKVKEVIEKMDKVTASINKFKLSINSSLYSTYVNHEEKVEQRILAQKDKINGTSYSINKGTTGNKERYFSKGFTYYKQSNETKWSKYETETDNIEDFYGLSELYEKNSLFYAGLTVLENKKKNEIILKGLSYNTGYLFFIIEGGVKELYLTDYSYEMTIDKSTYRIKNIKFYVKGEDRSLMFDFEKKLQIDITEMNGNFKIIPPKGIKNAELMEG
jgi:peptidyl-prolyl cis-trans isomerase B (cyclophilin B)